MTETVELTLGQSGHKFRESSPVSCVLRDPTVAARHPEPVEYRGT